VKATGLEMARICDVIKASNQLRSWGFGPRTRGGEGDDFGSSMLGWSG